MSRLVGIQYKPAKGADPIEVKEGVLIDGFGLYGDVRCKSRRPLTLLSVELWNSAVAEAGVPGTPWNRRRSNLAAEGLPPLAGLIGKTLEIGKTVVEIFGEVDPCDMLEGVAPGLMKATEPDFRGGIWCKTVIGGVIRVGDEIRVIDGQ
ncbi:MAG: MOSC domain-containing protein [Planctomycetes bacterium]|nr:MOSC domain-containing protein [Planctomycetota bacterium]